MKTLILTFIPLAIFMYDRVCAQQFSVVSFQPDASKILITYELAGLPSGDPWLVDVYLSVDGGRSFESNPLTKLSGNTMAIASGAPFKGTIVWDVLAEREQLVADQVMFKLMARPQNASSGMFTDARDGQQYPWVKIGEQIWMAKNMNFATPKGSYVYLDDPRNEKKFGRLYDYDVISQVCPDGWRVPAEEDWLDLMDYLGSWEVAGGKLKLTSQWLLPNTGATNETGFNGAPAGHHSKNGEFYGLGQYGYFWCAPSARRPGPFYRYLRYDQQTFMGSEADEDGAISIRCIKE